MHKHLLGISFAALCFIGLDAGSAPEEELGILVDRAVFHDKVHSRNEGALQEESTQLEQSKTLARSRSDYGLELRPGVSDDDVGLALRIYLPDRWSKKRLQQQLTLAATSEQLRIAALEWQDIVAVYRDFCTYRMLNKQMALLQDEMRFIEPYLEKADQQVELNQLSISDRARLYSTYLALVNDFGEQMTDFLDTQRRIRMVLGPDADLDRLAALAVIKMPSQMEINSLMQLALSQRSDYRKLGVDLEAMQLAEQAARSEDGFRLKYIQPAYRVDYDDGTDGWELSASIVLPWGTRNPDIAVYQHQQMLYQAARSQQRRIIEDRLRVTFELARAHAAQTAAQEQRTTPLMKTLEKDIAVLSELPLAQVREVLTLRERMLDAALQAAESERMAETIAVDLAEELGDW